MPVCLLRFQRGTIWPVCLLRFQRGTIWPYSDTLTESVAFRFRVNWHHVVSMQDKFFTLLDFSISSIRGLYKVLQIEQKYESKQPIDIHNYTWMDCWSINVPLKRAMVNHGASILHEICLSKSLVFITPVAEQNICVFLNRNVIGLEIIVQHVCMKLSHYVNVLRISGNIVP